MSYADIELSSSSDYLKFTSGQVVTFNILTKNPSKSVVHFEQGKKSACLLKDCDLCAAGNKAKQRWSIEVWDRKDNSVKKLEFGPSIAGQLKSIAEMMQEHGKTIHNTDIRVKTTGSGMETEYSVLSVPMSSEIPGDVLEKYSVPF